MRRFLLLLAVVGGLAMADWPLTKLTPSLAWLQKDGSCTAFSIHQKERRFVTATHCGPFEGVKLDDFTGATVLESQPGNAGLTVLQLPEGTTKSYPALKMGPLPEPGTELMVAGYTLHTEHVLAFTGILMEPHATFEGEEVQFLSVSGMMGMSGAPIVTRKNELVGVMIGGAQFTPVPTIVSFSARYEAIAALVQKYGEK